MSSEFNNLPVEELRFANAEFVTIGKNPPQNEDLVGINESTLVLSDGATDKTGLNFEGRTGGELASQIVVETCLQSGAHGEELVGQVTANLQSLYSEINPHALSDSAYRFAATMVAAKIVGDSIIVTQVGDSSFRINGTDEFKNDKLVDALTSNLRKEYIAATGDINGSRQVILPLLKAQHAYQNNSQHPLGYGVIDGTPVPKKFINVFVFPASDIHTIELVSDGYYGVFPESPTTEGYEEVFQMVQSVDPNKCGQFPSTKLSDDRTALIALCKRIPRDSRPETT